MTDQYGPPNNVIGSGSLNVFGGSTVQSYDSVSNQYAKSATSYNEATKNLAAVSAASGLGAVGAGFLGQPEVSAGLSVVSGFSGVGASVTGYLGAQDSNVAGYAQSLANVALQRAEGLPVSAQQQTNETDSFWQSRERGRKTDRRPNSAGCERLRALICCGNFLYKR